MAYIKKIWNDYPDPTTPILASDMNNIENGIENIENGIENIENGIENIENGISNGWVSAGETWEYASVDDPTGVIYATGDVTQKYSVGMRIKFTNNSNTVYGIITAVSNYDSVNNRTSITFLHEINPTNSQALHLMQNSAITNTYYSNVKAPYGFPLDPDKWSVTLSNTTSYNQMSPTQNTWYNFDSFDTPIGKWRVTYKGMHTAGDRITAGYISCFACLSKVNNNADNNELHTGIYQYLPYTTGQGFGVMCSFCGIIINDVKTTLYLNARTTDGGVGRITLNINAGGTFIRLVIAYL